MVQKDYWDLQEVKVNKKEKVYISKIVCKNIKN